MLKRFTGSKIIRFYDEKGDFIKEINVLDFEPLFSWTLFMMIFLPGSIIMGNVM